LESENRVEEAREGVPTEEEDPREVPQLPLSPPVVEEEDLEREPSARLVCGRENTKEGEENGSRV
jgi:hypothetical protein